MDIFHQQVHPFSKYLLSIYYLLGTLLFTDDSSEQETKTCPYGAYYILVGIDNEMKESILYVK